MIVNIPARAYSQYRTKPKFMAWLQIAHEMGGDLMAAAEAVKNSYDIDSAVGEQLDVIARIVVLDRAFVADIPLGQYVCTPDDMDQPLCGDPNIVMSAATAASDSTMSDSLFRIAIRAKIAKNNGDASIRSILDQMALMLPGAVLLRVIDNEDMTFSIDYGGEVSLLEKWALLNVDLIQRPQGVLLTGFQEVIDVVQFGDESRMFGDEETQFTSYQRTI